MTKIGIGVNVKSVSDDRSFIHLLALVGMGGEYIWEQLGHGLLERTNKGITICELKYIFGPVKDNIYGSFNFKVEM